MNHYEAFNQYLEGLSERLLDDSRREHRAIRARAIFVVCSTIKVWRIREQLWNPFALRDEIAAAARREAAKATKGGPGAALARELELQWWLVARRIRQWQKNRRERLAGRKR